MFDNLKIDPSSLLFSEERIDSRVLIKLKKSKYAKDRELLKLVNLGYSKYFLDDDTVLTRADYVKKKEKLIGLLCIVLMFFFNYFMPTLEI